MLSKRRNKTAATTFFARAMEVNGLPRKIVIGKSGANTAGITAINRMLKRFGCPIPIEMVRIEFLNDLVEQPSRGLRTNRCRAAHARFQIIRISLSDLGGDRGRKHDPQGSVDTRTLPVCRIRGAGSSTEGT